jgi:hypothetical protein
MHALVPFKLLPRAFRVKPGFIGGDFHFGLFGSQRPARTGQGIECIGIIPFQPLVFVCQASAFRAVPTEF